MIDTNYKAWLLEVNLSPSLNTDSKLDRAIKTELLVDLFNLVGIVPAELRVNEVTARFFRHERLNTKFVIDETAKELKRCGKFQRIFPSEDSYRYKRFFEKVRLSNEIVCAKMGRLL
jgi:hypothetical protein